MLKTIAIRIGAIVGASVAAMALLGTGTSAADPYVGKTYADAAATISERGGHPVISTVVGAQLATDDCIVEAWHRVSYVSEDNFDHDKKKYMLSLNCTAKLAQPGLPGNSLASAEGRAEKHVQDRAENYNSKPSRCARNLESCQKFCEKYGLCSEEVMALF